jgi:hypothetical protein
MKGRHQNVFYVCIHRNHALATLLSSANNYVFIIEIHPFNLEATAITMV